MSRFLDAVRRAERMRASPRSAISSKFTGTRQSRAYQVVSVVSNKGGVGKTTIATNLALYVRAMREDLPILVLSLDDQTGVDQMFRPDETRPTETLGGGLRSANLRSAIRLGRHAVHYVPSASDVGELKREIVGLLALDEALSRAEWNGLVIIDTKSDLEILTRNAIAASDLVLVVVKDQASLLEARKVYALLEAWGRPRGDAQIVLSMIDLRVKYGADSADRDILQLLLTRIREGGYPVLPSFLSYSPKIESLVTNPDGSALSVIHDAVGSVVHQQMGHLADDVLKRLKMPRALETVVSDAPASGSPIKSLLLHGNHGGRPPASRGEPGGVVSAPADDLRPAADAQGADH